MISWHRFYDPETGRYITADPIGLDGGINLYAYALGNPINYIDPEGLWVKLCSRKLGPKNKGRHRKPSGSPLRHDYLNISGQIKSFQAGSNMLWSDGWVDDDEYPINQNCTMICKDDKFDQYVLKAAQYSPKYCVIAYPGTTPYGLGARNCQSWAREVLKRAKQEYLKNEKCPECFK